MKKLGKVDVPIHRPLRPSLMDSTQDSFSECKVMEGTITIRNPLMITKLRCNMTCGIVRAMMKPNQRNRVLLKTTSRHGLNAPPFHHPLNAYGRKMLQEFGEFGRINLFVFELAIMVMLWLIPTKRDNGRIKQLEPLIQPYLREGKGKHECLTGKMRDKNKRINKRERKKYSKMI